MQKPKSEPHQGHVFEPIVRKGENVVYLDSVAYRDKNSCWPAIPFFLRESPLWTFGLEKYVLIGDNCFFRIQKPQKKKVRRHVSKKRRTKKKSWNGPAKFSRSTFCWRIMFGIYGERKKKERLAPKKVEGSLKRVPGKKNCFQEKKLGRERKHCTDLAKIRWGFLAKKILKKIWRGLVGEKKKKKKKKEN